MIYSVFKRQGIWRLARELKQKGVKEYIKLHELPACVTVDDNGFLAKVTINL